jgi:V8-like Glu-specific endopeptidase
LAEWLRSGLQSRLHQFDSGRRLADFQLIETCGTVRASRLLAMKEWGRGTRGVPVARRRLVAAVLIGVACVVIGGWTSPIASAGVSLHAEVRHSIEFWTPARMRAAKPLDVSRPGSPQLDAGGPLEGGIAPRVLPRVDPGARASSSALEAVANPTAEATRVHGAVFIDSPFGLGRCSGTSVNAPNFSVVITAAHCVRSPGPSGRWFDFGWVFVPGYRFGQRPFGVFPAKWLDTTLQWRISGSENYDVAAAVVGRNERGQRLAKAVGGTGIAWGLKPQQVFDVHGYPASPPFDGETQQVCTQTPFLGHDSRSFIQPGPLNLATSCDVTGGASGGGWTIRGDVLNGVTDYGYEDAPDLDFSAYFGREVGHLYRRAARVR